MIMGIYKIEDKKGKIYIGSSVDIKQRWLDHRSALNNNKHRNSKLQNAWNKYGADYFTFTIIQVVKDRAKLLLQEQKYLNLLFHYYTDKEHYNILSIAGSPLGTKLSEETKAKIGAANKGKVRSAEHIANMVVYLSKTYTLLSPDGQLITITNMAQFCRDHGYSNSNMNMVAHGKKKSAYGYTNPNYKKRGK